MLVKTDNAVHVHSNVLFLSLLGNAHKLNLSKYNRDWSRIFFRYVARTTCSFGGHFKQKKWWALVRYLGKRDK